MNASFKGKVAQYMCSGPWEALLHVAVLVPGYHWDTSAALCRNCYSGRPCHGGWEGFHYLARVILQRNHLCFTNLWLEHRKHKTVAVSSRSQFHTLQLQRGSHCHCLSDGVTWPFLVKVFIKKHVFTEIRVSDWPWTILFFAEYCLCLQSLLPEETPSVETAPLELSLL